MPTYKYKALTDAGVKVEGTRSANTKDELAILLRQSNQYPVQIDELVEGGRSIELLEYFRKVKTKDIAIFCRQFYTMLNAGVIILNCLDILRHQTPNKKLRRVIGEMYEKVQKGMTLSEALATEPAIFPDLLVNMVAAGEVSGTLDIVMSRMAVHYEKENRVNSKVKGAMVYPTVLGLVALGMLIFLLTYVLPTFVDVFESSGVALPLITQLLLAASAFVVSYGIYLAIGVIAVIYGIQRYSRTDSGRMFFDRAKLRIPVLKNLYQMIYTSRFTRTLSTLISSGTPLIKSLESVAEVIDNVVVEKGLRNAIEDVKKGVNLSTPIRNMGLFPPMVHYMISIGEESGTLDNIMDRTAAYYDDELETTIAAMVSLLEPVMILVMAVFVGGIVASIMLPVFNMSNTAG